MVFPIRKILKWTILALIPQIYRFSFFDEWVVFRQRNRTKSLSKLSFSPGYHIGPNFRRMPIFSPGTRLFCARAVTNRYPNVATCFCRTKHNEPTRRVPRSSEVYADAIECFHHILQACITAPGMFEQDCVWFPPTNGLCLVVWRTNTELSTTNGNIVNVFKCN